jgi:hypothetical protein
MSQIAVEQNTTMEYKEGLRPKPKGGMRFAFPLHGAGTEAAPLALLELAFSKLVIKCSLRESNHF